MDELSKLLQSNETELLSSIDGYQEDIIKTFLSNNSNDYLKSADNWLNATTANTSKFGGEPNRAKIYRDKLLDEIEKFICGDHQYDDDRRKIADSADKSQKYIIGVMSASIGKILGAAGPFIAPVIVLLLLSFGKMATNAWCAMRKDLKNSTSKSGLG